MFGFPFFTSLIVTVALVVGFSFVINKGTAKRRAQKQEASSQASKKSTKETCHA
jgi:preprotein translocase subunit YajC